MFDEDQEKQEAMLRAKGMYAANGNLAPNEIEELVCYEFIKSPTTLEEQIRRYFLMVKRDSPERAARLLKEIRPLLKKDARTEQEIHDLSLVLARFVSGACLVLPLTQEARDEMAQEFPLPLKVLTLGSEEPYQVWRGRSHWAKWKAWRQGRPAVLGYGMTEEEAVDDLRYRVQPDLDGTLDGFGVPKGPAIGGNMFSVDHVTQHNKRRFVH